MIKENTVKEDIPGTYKVIYEVADSKNKMTTKEIKVTVKEKVEINEEDIDIEDLLEKQEDGEFYLESLDWDNNTKKYTMSGYCIILNQNNTNKEYALVFINKNTEEVYVSEISSWQNNVPYDLGSSNGNSYSDSWFKGEIDFSDIPNGDYEIYMIAATDNNYTIQIVDNFFNQDIKRRAEDDKHGYSFKVLESLKTQQLELSVRDELYTTSTSPTYRNMVNEFETMEFQNNKLYIQGYSYNYKGLYKEQLGITRKIIFENTDNYTQYIMDLGCAEGPYELKTKDNLDKKYAWYEKNLDISELPKGTYSVQIYTKTTNAEDYGELSDMFGELNETVKMNNKTYQITHNKDRLDRVELIIK